MSLRRFGASITACSILHGISHRQSDKKGAQRFGMNSYTKQRHHSGEASVSCPEAGLLFLPSCPEPLFLSPWEGVRSSERVSLSRAVLGSAPSPTEAGSVTSTISP